MPTDQEKYDAFAAERGDSIAAMKIEAQAVIDTIEGGNGEQVEAEEFVATVLERLGLTHEQGRKLCIFIASANT